MTESNEGNSSVCKECNCYCTQCTSSSIDEQWQQEVNNLQQKLVDAENYIVKLEDSVKDIDLLQSDLVTWKDKYKRLHEAHKRVQKLNQGLEDKLLRLVELNEVEKNTLTKDVTVVSHKLAEANYTIKNLTLDNERYKKDVSLAVQFLQCKNGSFVSHKFASLPRELRHKITEYLFNTKKKQMDGEARRLIYEPKSIKIPISANRTSSYKLPNADTDHQTTNVDRDKPVIDVVSAAIMAKVFEERERERANVKHCDTCKCNSRLNRRVDTISTQTSLDVASTNLVRDSIRNRSVVSHFKDLDLTTCQNVAKVSPNNYLNGSQHTNASVCQFDLSPIHSNHRENEDYYDEEVSTYSRTLHGKKDTIYNSRKIFPSIMYFNVNERKARKNKNTKYGQYESLHSYCESPSDSSMAYTDDNSCDEHSTENPTQCHLNDHLNDSGISINNSYNNNPGTFIRDPSPVNVRQITDNLIDVTTPKHNYKLSDVASPKHIVNRELQTYYSLETRTSDYYVEKLEEQCSNFDKITSSNSNLSQEEVDNNINNTPGNAQQEIIDEIMIKETISEDMVKKSCQIDALLYHYRLNFDDNSLTNSDVLLSNSVSDDCISNDHAMISTASSSATTEDLQDQSMSDDSNAIDGNVADSSLGGIDKERYAEMEMNVKRFLFGDANLYSSVTGISGDQS